jgi:hypothetical protein
MSNVAKIIRVIENDDMRNQLMSELKSIDLPFDINVLNGMVNKYQQYMESGNNEGMNEIVRNMDDMIDNSTISRIDELIELANENNPVEEMYQDDKTFDSVSNPMIHLPIASSSDNFIIPIADAVFKKSFNASSLKLLHNQDEMIDEFYNEINTKVQKITSSSKVATIGKYISIIKEINGTVKLYNDSNIQKTKISGHSGIKDTNVLLEKINLWLTTIKSVINDDLGHSSVMHGEGFGKSTISKSIKTNDNLKFVSIDDDRINVNKYYISNKLLNQNVLRVSYKNNTVFIKNTKISNNIKKLLLKIIVNNKSVSKYEFKKLDDDDKNLLYNIVKKMKLPHDLIKNIAFQRTSKEDNMIQRFEVLKGQIIAGNNNLEMLNEFKLLINVLSKNDQIDKREAGEILIMLNELNM